MERQSLVRRALMPSATVLVVMAASAILYDQSWRIGKDKLRYIIANLDQWVCDYFSPVVDNIVETQLGNHVQQAGTADANGRFARDGLDFQPIFLQPNMLNGPGGGAHPKLDMCSLEGRTGGTRDADHFALMVEANLGIGANINCQADTVHFRDSSSEQHSNMVCPNVPGDVG